MKSKTQVRMSTVREAFASGVNATQPAGRKTGTAVKRGVLAGVGFAVLGAGSAWGFVKGLVS